MRLKEGTISANTGLDAIKRAPIVDYDTGLKCIRIQDISQNKQIDEWGFTETNERDRNKFLLKKDDLLIARTGATVGVSQFIDRDLDAVYNNGTIRLRFDKSLNPKFIYYVFQTNSFLQYIDNISCVATQPNLRIEGLLRFTIPDYSIEAQNRIVKSLTVFDKLIINNNERIKLLEQMIENIYKEWFVRFRFPGFKNTEFTNGIPYGWNYTTLDKIVSFDRGISYSSEEIECDDGVNLINLKNIQSYGGFRREGTKKFNGKFKESQVVKRGDLILGVTDMTQDRRTVGHVAMIPTMKDDCVISADLVKVNSKISKVFLYSMFRYGFYSKYFSQFANGANVLHLKPGVLMNKKILMPSKELIDEFSKEVSPMIEMVDKLNLMNDNLIKQRDYLLPRLMSGKLEV